MNVAPLNRSLDQELVALLRGASLECPVCSEFVLIRDGVVGCLECGLRLSDEGAEKAGLQLTLQAG